MNQRVLTLASLALILAFSTWFFLTHEKVTDTQFTGYDGEARYNNFLAAQMLFTELGFEAESLASLTPSEWLPETSDTIFTRASSTLATTEQSAYIMNWVGNGGHLVLLPPRPHSDLTDEFMASFGYEYVVPDWLGADDETHLAQGIGPGDGSLDYDVNLDATYHRIGVADDASQSATLSDDLGFVAVRREYGNGFVSVVTGYYFQNETLSEEDHALLLMDVVAGYIEPGKIWVVYDSSFPALWELIWTNAPFVVLGCLLLLFTGLWSVIPKFGPRIEPEPPARRSIMEHVNAAGIFAWRQHGSDDLAKSAVTALLHDAEARHPGLGRLPLQEQAMRIAQMTDRDPQKVFDLLNAAGDHRRREFTQHMTLLQRLRNEL